MRLRVCKSALLFSIIFLVACQSEYTSLVEDELASGVRNDSIFYSFEFGQTKTEFYNV